MERILIVIALTVLIHLVGTLAYSVRVAGVRTGRLLTAFSLYNIIFLLVSFSHSIQAPLLTSLMEMGIKSGSLQAGVGMAFGQLVYHEAYREHLALLSWQMRAVIMAATLGTLGGAFLMPFFVRVFVKAIGNFEASGSLIKAFTGLGSVFGRGKERGKPRRQWRKGLWKERRLLPALTLPRNFLIANIVVTGIYTTSVLSAIYAGAMFPDFRTTATMLSAAVSGFATVLAAVVVEPAASSITDEALRGDRAESDVRQLAIYMAITRLLGTLLAQAFFLPCALLIKFIAQLVV